MQIITMKRYIEEDETVQLTSTDENLTIGEISSEYIEPYLTKFLGSIIEMVGTGLLKPEEARIRVRGVEHFVSETCGIHARLVMGNVLYNQFINVSDEELIELCQKTMYAHIEEQSTEK